MVDEHRELLSALQARDPKRMLTLLEQHIAVVPRPSRQARTAAPRARARSGSGRPPKGRGVTELLEVADLRTGFHTHGGVIRAVDGVDFAIEKGGALGVVGESGSGKSVTALSIMRLIDLPGRIEPGSSIVFDGRDLAALSEDEMTTIRGNDISMIFQEPMTSLNPVFTVGEQIAESVRLHQGVDQQGGGDARRRDDAARRDPVGREAHARLPTPDVRRHAPARHDRDGAQLQPEAPRSPTSRRRRST